MLWRMVISKLLKQLKSFKSFNSKGYTIIEAATVVVITGTLTVVAIPIASDKIEEAKVASASGASVAIGTAMAKFFGDNKDWPSAKTFSDTGSQITVAYEVLRSGKDANDDKLDPVDDTGSWPIVAFFDDKGNPVPDTGRVDNMNNHLVSDEPRVTNDPTVAKPRITYEKAGFNWLGPYIPAVDQDPWGQNFLAYVRAMRKGRNENKVRIYGWVISAGGNKRLETPVTSSIIKGDDIGTLVFSASMIEGVNDRTSIGLTTVAPEKPTSTPDVGQTP